ncbi:MAG: PPOX class F420-dependent oxidoreductase [Thermomicrobia bacterium]|nr:PPOX class F420-dependent oxidoreductase [Thermomicrobia bacterium]
MFTDEIRALLDAPRVGTLGTTNADGSPLLTPVWHMRDGDEIWLAIGPRSPKARNIRRDPRVVYVVMDSDGYTYVTITGRARMESGEGGAKPRAMAIRYLGEQAGARFAERDYIQEEIVCRITPEQVRLRRAE